MSTKSVTEAVATSSAQTSVQDEACKKISDSARRTGEQVEEIKRQAAFMKGVSSTQMKAVAPGQEAPSADSTGRLKAL